MCDWFAGCDRPGRPHRLPRGAALAKAAHNPPSGLDVAAFRRQSPAPPSCDGARHAQTLVYPIRAKLPNSMPDCLAAIAVACQPPVCIALIKSILFLYL